MALAHPTETTQIFPTIFPLIYKNPLSKDLPTCFYTTWPGVIMAFGITFRHS
jgi:hypothetical protein